MKERQKEKKTSARETERKEERELFISRASIDCATTEQKPKYAERKSKAENIYTAIWNSPHIDQQKEENNQLWV